MRPTSTIRRRRPIVALCLLSRYANASVGRPATRSRIARPAYRPYCRRREQRRAMAGRQHPSRVRGRRDEHLGVAGHGQSSSTSTRPCGSPALGCRCAHIRSGRGARRAVRSRCGCVRRRCARRLVDVRDQAAVHSCTPSISRSRVARLASSGAKPGRMRGPASIRITRVSFGSSCGSRARAASSNAVSTRRRIR